MLEVTLMNLKPKWLGFPRDGWIVHEVDARVRLALCLQNRSGQPAMTGSAWSDFLGVAVQSKHGDGYATTVGPVVGSYFLGADLHT